MAGFLSLSDRLEMTIRKVDNLDKHHPDQSHYMTRIGFIILALAHDLNNWTVLCWVRWKQLARTLELWCHHSGWGIVLQTDVAQMGKCCDPLESRMFTCMYSSGFCLISPNTIMWNIYDRERYAWIKFIKIHHKKSRESLSQQIYRSVLHTNPIC